MAKKPKTHIYTIGHENLSIKDFIIILKENDIRGIVDIRHNPDHKAFKEFQSSRLQETLKQAEIAYVFTPRLLDTKNYDLTIEEIRALPVFFKNYGAFMQTHDFKIVLNDLIATIENMNLALLGFHENPGKCIRALLSDTLLGRNISVTHLIPGQKAAKAKLSKYAIVGIDKVTYPEQNSE